MRHTLFAAVDDYFTMFFHVIILTMLLPPLPLPLLFTLLLMFYAYTAAAPPRIFDSAPLLLFSPPFSCRLELSCEACYAADATFDDAPIIRCDC